MRHGFSLLLTLATSLSLPAAEIQLVSPKPGEPPVVEATGLPKEMLTRLKIANLTTKQWPEVFRVVVAGGTDEEVLARPPIVGVHSLTASGIRFEPQFPLVPGRDYVAILQIDSVARPIRTTLSLPKPAPGPRVAVTAVYPSANLLPENTLRLYLHFSGNVARGGVYQHLKLVRDDGVEIKEPFLEVEEELWSADGKRLTVLFHPGRVKHGLVPREEEGPILEQGRRYTFSISQKWEDTEGRPLLSGFTKTFTAGPADEAKVDPDSWALTVPRAGSDSPLVVRLPKPLDHAMLGRVVRVVDAQGNPLAGELTVGGGERVLTFAPKSPWSRGDYKLTTDTRLEDVCGNNVARPFEIDVFRPVTGKIEVKTHERPFQVR